MLLSFAYHSTTTSPSASAILFAAKRRATFLHLAPSFSSSFSSSSTATADDDEDDDARRRDDARKQPSNLRRRTRGGGAPRDAAAAPSLADFVHRAKVLRQYRNFVRLARFVDTKDGGGSADNNNGAGGGCLAALDEVRQSYKVKMSKDTDALARNMAYSEGERKLREIGAMVGYSAGDRTMESYATTSPQIYDADSWINIQDSEDRRGRVGMQWPWERG